MKRSILLAVLTVAALSAPVAFGQEAKPGSAKPAMSMDTDRHMSQMQEKNKAMQGQMDRIRKTADPVERQKLMQDHMQAMQENMKMMRATGGPMMMSGGEPGGMMMGGKKDGMADGDMMKRHAMMENRMDMMQMMMEQMLEHGQMMQQVPPK